MYVTKAYYYYGDDSEYRRLGEKHLQLNNNRTTELVVNFQFVKKPVPMKGGKCGDGRQGSS